MAPATHTPIAPQSTTTETSKIPEGTISREGYVIGPNGVEMSEYEYQRTLKVNRNNMRLMQLGLTGEIQRNMRREASSSNSPFSAVASKPKKRKIEVSLEPTRRSARSRRGKNLQLQDSSDAKRSISAALKEEAEKLEVAEKKLTNRRTRMNERELSNSGARSIAGAVRILSQEDLTSLSKVSQEDWLEDMAYFMEHVLNNSRDNIRHSMDKVYKLAHGLGVKHRHSNREGNVFQQGTEITLGHNFDNLLAEAKSWVDDHGGDPSRGWLIVHPMKKIWTYQVARFDNGGKRFIEGANNDESRRDDAVMPAQAGSTQSKVVLDNPPPAVVNTEEGAANAISGSTNASTKSNQLVISVGQDSGGAQA